MNQFFLNRISRKISEVQDIFDVDLITDSLIDPLPVCIDDLYDSRTYCTVSHYRYIYHVFLLFPFSLFLLLWFPTQICVNKRVEIAIHDTVHITDFHIRTMVLHHRIRLHDIRPDLASEADLFDFAPDS